MPTKARLASKGVCSFCEDEVDKTKMTQHLKFCKQRAATYAEHEAGTKEKLFQILVEGRYSPEYWMQLEMPASEQLVTLDTFLRAIWLECCGHLSAFRIAGTTYEDERSYDSFPFQIIGAPEQETVNEEIVSEEEEEEEDISPEELAKVIGEWFDTYTKDGYYTFPPELGHELKTPRTRSDYVAFLKEKLHTLSQNMSVPKSKEEYEAQQLTRNQEHILELALIMVEDRSLGAYLQEVLKVGQKFTYQYDFGSTTDLNLRVVAEREGVADEEDDGVTILARNVAPVILCDKCGKPATQVSTEYSSEAYAFCDACAESGDEDSEMLLPVVNSPRMGVCGYTG